MEEKLMTKRDLAAFFQTSVDNARALCAKHGVQPLNVGAGKQTRLRWRLTEVMQVLTTLQTGTKPTHKDFRPRNPKDPKVLGRSAKDIHNELAILQ